MPARSRRVSPPSHRSRPVARRRGFTLVEILVVVTIVALLAGLVVPRLFSRVGGARANVAKSEVATIASQVSTYMLENNLSRLPDDFALTDLTVGDDRYLNEDDLVDPWDRPYIIVIPGDVNPEFDIVSYGADGEPGGEGEDADVVN